MRMTRINTIDPVHLADSHLMAEYRELPMVIGSLKRSLRTRTPSDIAKRIPPAYTLNKGHVSFFFDKQGYLFRRFTNLCIELRRRGYNINPRERNVDFEAFPMDFRKDWKPDQTAHHINLERIIYRINEKPHIYKMMSQPINVQQYVEMVEQCYEYNYEQS
jgi:deoxyribonuclease (pyrimidine dimer)